MYKITKVPYIFSFPQSLWIHSMAFWKTHTHTHSSYCISNLKLILKANKRLAIALVWDFLQNTLTKQHRQTFNFNIICIC